MNVLILGGSRFIGLEIVREQHFRGHTVTVFNRGSIADSIYPEGVRSIHGDRNDPGAVTALTEKAFDAVVDTSAYFPEQTQIAIEAFRGKVGHFVHCSTGAVYAPPHVFPIPESHPMGEWLVWGDYGRNKRCCDDLLLAAHQAGDLPVSIVRPPYVLGPGNYSPRSVHVFSRLQAGQPILLPGNGQALIQFVFVDEVARTFGAILDQGEQAYGKAYNCGNDESISLEGFVDLCCTLLKEAGYLKRDPDLIPVDLEEQGISPEPYSLADCIFPFANVNYLLDNRQVKHDLGISFRKTWEGLAQCLDWYLASPDRQVVKRYPSEARVLRNFGLLTEPGSTSA